MSENKSVFTGFRLWEMLFAPSLIQKWFWHYLNCFLTQIRFPTDRIIQRLDRFFFRKLEGIHDIKFQMTKEDELVFLYNFQTAYLIFLFPELEDLHGLLKPDNPDNIEQREKSIRFYNSLIKRHLYFFDSKEQKHFISKNPFHLIRIQALTTVFPKAKYLVIQRPVEKTIPSTIGLNNHFYPFFGQKIVPNPLRQQTIEILSEWDVFFRKFLEKPDWERLEIQFRNLVKNPSSEIEKIYNWLNLPIDETYGDFIKTQDEFSKNYRSRHQYSKLTKRELKRLIPSVNRQLSAVHQ